MVQIDDFDQQVFENNLSMMHAIKKQYALTLLDTSDYFTETLNFITRNTFIGNGPVFEILTKEQIAMQSLSAMHKDLKALLQALNSQQF